MSLPLQKYSSKLNTTSNNEKIIPNLNILQNQFKNSIKLTITEYAKNARNELNINIKIKEHISRIKYINDLFKKLLIDIMQKKETKVEIKNLLSKFNNIFKEDNKILKDEINEEYKKLIKYQISLKKEINPLKDKLNQLKNLNFILENKIIYQENDLIRNHIFLIMANNNINEDKEIEVINPNEFDEFLIEISKVYQIELNTILKNINKIKSKNLEKIEKITQLKKILNNKEDKGDKYNIEEIYENNNIQNNIKIENNIENSVSSFQEFELMPSLATLENIEKKIEADGIKIKSDIYNLPQKNLLKSCINENVIKNETNNIKRNNKRIKSLDINKNKIIFNSENELKLPKLNFKQIEFNKDNKKYKLSSNYKRRKTNTNTNSVDKKSKKNKIMIKYEIKKMKKKIKQIEDNIIKNQEIINDFKKFYGTIIDKYKYEEYIYEPEIESYVLTTKNMYKDKNI